MGNAVSPHESAIGIVVNKQGKILLNLRDDLPAIAHPNKWSLLGGRIEPREGALEALTRELREEADLKVSDATKVALVRDHEGSGDLLHVFLARTTQSRQELTVNEGQRLAFFRCDQLPTPLTPFAQRLLAAYSNGELKGPDTRTGGLQ